MASIVMRSNRSLYQSSFGKPQHAGELERQTAMNYQCPKCQVDLRHRFKGFVRLACPECGVRLFRTVSAAEVSAERTTQLQLWCFTAAALLVALLVVGDSGYLLPVLFGAIAAFAMWRVRRTISATPTGWPRWTDKAPW